MPPRIKCRPEDFRVEELTTVECQGGPHALYRLRKQSLGTPEAVEAVCRKWNLRRDQVSVGGLKDRHADTAQYFSIFRGPRRRLSQTNLSVEYVGQLDQPYTHAGIAANRFDIVVRDVPPEAHEALVAAIEAIRDSGWPNYFDEQRFGSLGVSGQFIAEPWCKGDYEQALWLALAEENHHDSATDKQQKQRLRDRWGRWPELRAELEPSPRLNIVRFLENHPRDFRRALAMIRVDWRRLYLAAFQSFLWNEMLSQYVKSRDLPWQSVPLGATDVACPENWPAAEWSTLEALELPLPSARDKHLSPTAAALLDKTLQGRGLEPRELRVKYPRDSFFSKGLRPTRVVPRNLAWQANPDDAYLGQECWRLQFDLPRGAYATMLVKSLFVGQVSQQPPEPEGAPDS